MAYDTQRGVTVMFGGFDYVSSTTLGDTWEWNGSTWTRVATTGPPPRAWCRMAYDSRRGVMVLFGGRHPVGNVNYGDTWEWDGSTWTQVFPATSPSCRYYQEMAYDSRRNVTVLFGGWNSESSNYFGDTWEWDGSAWTNVASSGPNPRAAACMAYDSKREVTVLFGGNQSTLNNPMPHLGDTWEWNGSVWQKVASTGPSARCNSAMAFDSQRGVTVLFGGGFPDTWEWNGSGWTQTASTGPPPRSMAAMAYESLRGVSVLFGGFSNFADTWEYTGPSVGNRSPVANAGPDQTVHVGRTATLNGSGSSDPDGDALRYAWSWVSCPAGSNAALSDPAAVNPSFTPDKEGAYTLQLVVTDTKGASSTPGQVVISTSNSPPVANAGTDQVIQVIGSTVTLNGSKSSDPDGDPLTFQWTLSKPSGSNASLKDASTACPSFVADVHGTYLAQLVVKDPWSASAPATVQITFDNVPPVAEAGPNQAIETIGTIVTLDGSQSKDANGDALTYEWSLTTKPADSTAVLCGANTSTPYFTADKQGDYVAQVTVRDGFGGSASDTVTVGFRNMPPVAEAGSDQAVNAVGTVVQLDGTQSYDANGDHLTYRWSMLSKPSESNAALVGALTSRPTFTVDVHGDYIIQVEVNDGSGGIATDTMKVGFNNIRPVANAGTSQSVALGDAVCLSGTGSIDANGDSLFYQWSFTTVPTGSSWPQSVFTTATPSFIPDLPGTYVVQLIVNDGFGGTSDPSTVTIQVTVTPSSVIKTIQTSLQPLIQQLPATTQVFVNANMKNTLANKLNAVIANIDAGNYVDALGQLQHDLLGKVDGIATTGKPDKNDWIKDPAAQTEVYNHLITIIAELKALLGQP
jgi:predicted lipoprotein with Yx(FWY)xxD motif